MRLHFLQHAPFEGPGSMAAWCERRRVTATTTRLYAAGRLPSLEEIDLLVILGGPMSVNDEKRCAWLRDEKRYVARAIDQGKRVLGICLGAQMIASALGARVYANPEPEIGWFPVEKTVQDDAAGLAGILPSRAEVFHWHGETFDLPKGAGRIARSDACENQAFSISAHVVGLQFHLETTREAAAGMVRECAQELEPKAGLPPNRFVQSSQVMLSAPERFARINGLMDRLLDAMCADLWDGVPR